MNKLIIKDLSIFKVILTLALFISCKNLTIENRNLRGKETKDSTDFSIKSLNLMEKKVGKDLFVAILDTIKPAKITTELLKNNDWVFTPFVNCISYMKFGNSGKGLSYDCEMDIELEMQYEVRDNKILVSEFDIPETDNSTRRKIKISDYTFIYNGFSLILVDAINHDLSGHSDIPPIEVLINYDMKSCSK